MVAGTAQATTPPPVASTVTINPGEVSTYSGSNNGSQQVDGYGRHSAVVGLTGITAIGSTLYLIQGQNNLAAIRSVNTNTGLVKTLVNSAGDFNGCGFYDGLSGATVCYPLSPTTDGNAVYFIDSQGGSDYIRRYDPVTGAIFSIASASSAGWISLVYGADGNFYLANTTTVYQLDPTDGILTTVLSGQSNIGGLAAGTSSYGLWIWEGTTTILSLPYGSQTPSTVTTISSGISGLVQAGQYLYAGAYGFIDRYDTTANTWTTVAGTGWPNFGDVDGTGAQAEFSGYSELAMDAYGRLWADDTHSYLRLITPGVYGASVTSANLLGDGNPSKVCEACQQARTGKTKYPVNDQTGNFWHSFTDLAIPGRGLALDFTRTYNSDPAALSSNGLFGPGWSFSYGMGLSVNGTTVTVNQENGAQVAFAQTGSTYAPTQSDVEASLSYSSVTGVYTFTRRNSITYTFNSSGQLTGETDLNGYTTTISYPTGQMVITDPSGRTITATISSGHITQIADQAGRSVSYSYDGAGNLTSATDVNGGITSFAYDSSHRMVEMRSQRYYAPGSLPTPPSACNSTPPANIVSNVYDSNGRVICQWDADARETQFAYTGNLTSGSTQVTDPKGNVTVDNFNNGQLTSETRGYGTSSVATWTFEYDPISGGSAMVTDPNGHLAQSFYDANGNLLTTVDALGRATTYTYNQYNQVTSVTPPATYGSAGTVTTTYTYDEPAYSSQGAGNLTTVSTPILSSTGTNLGTQVTHYFYCATSPTPSACPSGLTPLEPGDVTSMVDPTGDTWNYSYDSYGDRVSVTAPATSDNSDGSGSRSNTTKWIYNIGTGWVTEQLGARFVLANPTATTCTTPAVDCTTYTHDNMGRVLVTTDGDGHTSTNHYDADGNVDYTIDGDTNQTNYTYDPAGQETAVTRAYGTSSALTSNTNYWSDGTVEDQINAAGADTHYTYDPLGHLTGVTDPDSRTTGYQYDAVGNLLVRSDPTVSGCTTSSTTKGCTIYSYDGVNDLVAINYNDPNVTPNVTLISYDGNGRRTKMTEQVHGSTTSTVNSTWAYDSLSDLTATTDINGNTIGYGYDSRQEQTSISYPGTTGTISRVYDPAGRISSIQDWLGHTTTYTYDADNLQGAQTAPTTGTSVVDTSGYDNANNLTSIGAAQGSTSIDTFSYSYDGANQINSVTSTGVPSDNHTFTYNPLQQLATSSGLGTYTYDKANNPIALATPSSSNPAVQTFDAASQVNISSQITLIGTNTATGTAKTTTVNLPSGTAAGDQILVAVTVNNGVTLTTPTGYTLVGDYNTGSGSSHSQTALYRRTEVSGDTAVTIGQSATGSHSIALAVYSGVNTTTPIETTTNGTTPSGTTVTAPGLTTAQAGDQLLYIAGELTTATATWTYPTGFTTRTTATTTTTAESIADQPLVVPGTVSSQTATSNKTGGLVGILVALKPSQTTYSYDNRGDRTTVTPPSGTATTLGYNQARQLSSYTSSDTYTYNGDGIRMTKTTGTSTETYSWDRTGSIPLLLTDTAPTVTENYVYDPNGLPLEQISGTGTVTWYHHDALGSTRALTSTTGSVTGTETYTPYGGLQASTGTLTPLGYTGAYSDSESGYLYLINRYYDPASAQFLTVDPLIAQTQSAYGYVSGNPLNSTDPLGLWGWNPLSDVKQAVHDAGSFVAKNAQTISTVASVVAVLPVPGLNLVAGAVAIGTGAIATYEQASEGNWTSAALDAIGVAGGVGSLAKAGQAAMLAGRARTFWMLPSSGMLAQSGEASTAQAQRWSLWLGLLATGAYGASDLQVRLPGDRTASPAALNCSGDGNYV